MSAIAALRRLANPGAEAPLRIHWLRGAGAGIVLQGLSLVLAFGSGVLAARLLKPAGFGYYAYALAIASVAAVPAALGLPTAATRFLAVYRHGGNWELARGFLRRANQLAGGAAVCLALGMGIGGVFVGQVGGLTILLAAPLIPLLVWNTLRQKALQGLHHPVAAQLPEQLVKHSSFLLIGGSLSLVGTTFVNLPRNLMAIWLLASIVAFLTGTVLLTSLSPRPMRDARPRYAVREWLGTSLPMLVADSVGVVYATMDIILLGVLRPASDVGLYQVAVRTAGLLLIFVTASNSVLAPWFARLHSEADQERLQRVVTQATRAVFGLTLCVFIAFSFWGRGLLELFFGAAYARAYEALMILGAARLIDVATGPVVNLLAMTGGQKVLAKTIAAAAVLNVVGCLIFIPRLGMIGAAASSAVAMVVTNLVLASAVRHNIQIRSTIFGVRI